MCTGVGPLPLVPVRRAGRPAEPGPAVLHELIQLDPERRGILETLGPGGDGVRRRNQMQSESVNLDLDEAPKTTSIRIDFDRQATRTTRRNGRRPVRNGHQMRPLTTDGDRVPRGGVAPAPRGGFANADPAGAPVSRAPGPRR